MAAENETASSGPTLRVMRGDATPEEIAAILAIVSARSLQATEAQKRAQRGGWNDRGAAMRPMHAPGPGAWRSSSWS